MTYSGKKPFAVPGARGLEIIRAAVAGGIFDDGKRQSDRQAAAKANGNGYLDRDPKDGAKWYPTEKARQMLAWLESQIAGGVAVPVASVGEPAGSGVAAMEAKLGTARALLAHGDVMAARELAEGIYEQAKAGGRFSARFRLKESLEACHRIQADALSIEVRTKMRIAEEWEKAKAEGKTLKGRPKSVPDENAFTAEEAGLTRKDLHYAKQLLEADRREPGIAERAIAARLQAGLEPSRSNLRASIGTKTATKEERGDNLYQTGPEAMFTLLGLESFCSTIFEPACGKGAIVRHLEAAGWDDLILADLIDYGTADQFGEVQKVEDFLTSVPLEVDGDFDIVTNPPYGTALNAFVAHALRVHRPRKMALLLNVNFFGGFDDDDRNFALDECSPARIWWFSRRLPMMHREGWEGNKANSSMNTAWFIWELQPNGTYATPTIIRRVDWKDYVPAELAAVVDDETEKLQPESEDA